MAGILEASLQIATALIAAMSASEKQHEETLTGTLLGSMLASNSLLALFTAHLNVPHTQCWWGSYSKYKSKEAEKTEAGSGADFALLTLPETGGARLAIFQAKRGEVRNGRWIFDANRIAQAPKDDAADPREPQMLVLVETARRLSSLAYADGMQRRVLSPVTPEPPLTQKELDGADLGSFDWIHYLAYTSEGTQCNALRCVT